MDSCDDDDYGAGSVVLRVLTENDITHKALFIVRKCGEKLNQDRMPCYSQIASAIFAKSPVNSITGKMQGLKTENTSMLPPVQTAPTMLPSVIRKNLPTHLTFAGVVKKKPPIYGGE